MKPSKVGDMVFLHRSKAGVTFPQNKMAKLYVGPFPVVEVISRVAYKLGLPKSMQVNRVVNIQYLRRAPPAQRPFIASGPPDQPGERIDPAPLIIRSLLTASDENNITDLLALTDFGVYDVHELCRRGHYQEVLAYVSDSTSFWSHVLPTRSADGASSPSQEVTLLRESSPHTTLTTQTRRSRLTSRMSLSACGPAQTGSPDSHAPRKPFNSSAPQLHLAHDQTPSCSRAMLWSTRVIQLCCA